MSVYENDNIFAKIIRGEIPNHTIFENEIALVFMDVMPMSKGHCLVVPKKSSINLLDADPLVLSQLMPIVQKTAKACKKAMNANGIIVQQLNEQSAGQSVFHLHFHIIPTYENEKLNRHATKMAENNLLAKYAKAISSELN